MTSLCIINFHKSFIDLKSTQYLGMYVINITYTHASVVLVIFHYYVLQNKQSNRYSLYSITSVVVLFAYQIKLNILTRKELRKFYQRSCIIILTDFPNAIKKMLDKISFHKHFEHSLVKKEMNEKNSYPKYAYHLDSYFLTVSNPCNIRKLYDFL